MLDFVRGAHKRNLLSLWNFTNMYEPMVFSRKFAIWALYGFTYAQVKYSLLKIRGRIRRFLAELEGSLKA